jgi:RHS repeat-associated protein
VREPCHCDVFRCTGKERDVETNNDFFQARYLSAFQGRFTSPDPLGNFVADPTNPQSWNMYGYTLNSPLVYTDPTGLYTCAGCSTGNPWGISFTWDPAAEAWGLEAIASLQYGLIGGPIYNWSTSYGGTFGYSYFKSILAPRENLNTLSSAVVAPNNLTACQATTLNMINQQFGTTLTADNVLPTSDPNPQANGGQVNTNFGIGGGLSASQFNAISSGRYAPGGFWGFITGYGSSLHSIRPANPG